MGEWRLSPVGLHEVSSTAVHSIRKKIMQALTRSPRRHSQRRSFPMRARRNSSRAYRLPVSRTPCHQRPMTIGLRAEKLFSRKELANEVSQRVTHTRVANRSYSIWRIRKDVLRFSVVPAALPVSLHFAEIASAQEMAFMMVATAFTTAMTLFAISRFSNRCLA